MYMKTKSTAGVHGVSPFIKLPYFDWAQTHMLDTMHVFKNIGQSICNELMGVAADHTILVEALKSVGMFPSVTRAVEPSPNPWMFPPSIRKDAVQWCAALKLPKLWTTEHGYMFTITSQGKCTTLKAHTYQVLLSAGILAEAANYPRNLEDPSSKHIAKYVGVLSQVVAIHVLTLVVSFSSADITFVKCSEV